jgi:hypothetical protein
MAAIDLYKKCSNCSASMKADVYVCPTCGYECIRPMSLLLAVGIAFIPPIFSWFVLRKGYSRKAKIISIGWLIISCLLVLPGQFSGRNSQRTSEISEETQKQRDTPKQTEVVKNWEYTADLDKMRNTTSYWAICESKETKNFGFPYTKVKQQIVLRKRPSDGFNIMISLTEGQYSCDFDGCIINVKFDDGPIKKFSATRSNDLESGVLFVSSKSRFMSNLIKSSRVMIEANYFQHGPKTFEFNVDGLEWNH